MMNGNYWKYGLTLGAGVAIGALGAVLLSRGSIDLKKGMATVLSHGMDLPDKAATLMETAKENVDDLAAEARQTRASRKEEAKS